MQQMVIQVLYVFIWDLFNKSTEEPPFRRLFSKKYNMKKTFKVFLLMVFCATVLTAQRKDTEVSLKNSFRFNLGVPAMTSGGNLGFYFDTRYLYRFNKRMAIGGMMSFVSSGEKRRSLNPTIPTNDLRFVNSSNPFYSKEGLVKLSENQYKTEHIGGSFLFNYDIIQRRKRSLSAYVGIGLSHISLHDTPLIVLADVTPVFAGAAERYIVFVPEYARLLDISMPFGINYNYNINERWFIGCDVGATLYQKYTGFYYHLAFCFGAKF
jgi:hypothetical protein